MAGAKCVRTGRPPKNWSHAPIAINQTATLLLLPSLPAHTPIRPPPTSPRAQICSGKPHTFSTCRLNQLVTVIEAIAHYLGSNIFVFILFYNLYLAHYTPTVFALNASFGQ